MKIDKVKVENFGIISSVDLDVSSPEGSLVFLNGRNGRGKTTFQAALRWCFYGEEPSLSKFVSSYALENSEVGQTITTRVVTEIRIDSRGTVAVIERRQIFQKTDEEKVRKVGASSLDIKTRKPESGAFTEIAADSELWLETFFPKRLMNFFLFDGEMMKNFFDLKVKGEVENAVKEIAGVDRFNNIAINLKSVEMTLNRKISKLTGSKAERINIEYENQQKLLADVFLEFTALKDLLLTKELRNVELGQSLAGHEGQADAAERLRSLDTEESQLRAALSEAEEEFQSEILTHGTNGLLVSAFPQVRKEVLKAEEEDWLPPPFDPDRVRKLLEDKKCICGSHLEPGDEKSLALESLIEKHQFSSGVGKILSQMSHQLDLVEAGLRNGWKLIEEKNKSINDISKQMDRILKEKTRLLELMQGNDATELRLKIAEKKQLDSDIRTLVRDVARLQASGETLTHKVASLKRELDEAAKGNVEAESLRAEADWAHQIAEAAGQIHAIAIDKVRERLQESFTKKFAVVKKGKFITKITQDFEVKTLNEFGKETELSEGEKMMKAYIFSIALREVINLGFPLVVDTPFGRLDSPNRAELAQMLSTFLQDEVSKSDRQAFFLMQDTEYNPYTRRYFENLHPIEAYLAKDPKFENIKSDLGYGIDPDWLKFESWKDWAEGKLG